MSDFEDQEIIYVEGFGDDFGVETVEVILDGPQGPIGATGPASTIPGPTGATGATGAQGATGPAPEGGGSNPAAAILITPSLTPSSGDTIQVVFYSPGTPERVGDPEAVDIWDQITIPQDWGQGNAYTFDEANDAGMDEHVLLFIDSEDSTWPTVYAVVTEVGFTPVELTGSAPVHISCGGAGIGGGSTWIGRNEDTSIGETNENSPAAWFEPTQVTEAEVWTGWERNGNLNGMSTQKDINDWLDTLNISGAAGIPETEYTVFVLFIDMTVEDLIGAYGYGAATTAFYWDTDNALKWVDATAETITLADPQPLPGQTVTIMNTLSTADGFQPLGQAVTVALDGTINPAGPYLYQTVVPPDAVTSVDGRTGVVTLDDLYVTPSELTAALPYIPVGRIYDVTDPQFGAVGDGVADDTEAFEAACAAAFLLPGTIFVPGVSDPETEFYSIRRRIVVPNYSTLAGQGLNSIIKKTATVRAELISIEYDVDGVSVVTVDDASVFAVGDEITISDDGNWEWNATHAIIDAIDTDTDELTLDRFTISSYEGSNPKVLTQFPMVANSKSLVDMIPAATHGIRVMDIVLDQNFGGDDPTDSTLIDFTNSAIHWERTYDTVVSNVHILNASGDAYSDQGRAPGFELGTGASTQNSIHNSHIHSSARHGVHIGSNTSGAQVVNNRITDCSNMAMFLCRNAQNTVFTGNRVENCRQGVAGSDVRQGSDDEPVTGATPLDDIRGDIGTVVTGNTFIGGPLSDAEPTQAAIHLGAQGVAVGNNIIDWNGGIIVVQNAVDCTVSANNISLSPNYAGHPGIDVGIGAHRAKITGNSIRGGGFSATPVVKGDYGIKVESANSVIIGYNTVIDTEYGYVFAGDILDLQFAHNVAEEIGDSWGLIRVYGTLTDSAMDITGMNVDTSESANVISYNDNAAGSAMLGEAAQVRLLINGVGDNGSDDPATAGEWNAATDRYDRSIVSWYDGDVHISQFVYGTGWVELTSAAGAGATGPQGATGPAGSDSTVPGPAGATGATGAVGSTGPAFVVSNKTFKPAADSTRPYILPGVIPSAATTNSPSTGRAYPQPILLEETRTFDMIACEVTTQGSASTLARMGVYSADQYWQPDTLIQDFGTVDVASSTGMKTLSISLTLTPGRYQFVFATGPFGGVSAGFRIINGLPPFDQPLNTAASASAFLPITSVTGNYWTGTYNSGFPTNLPVGATYNTASTSPLVGYFIRLREAV